MTVKEQIHHYNQTLPGRVVHVAAQGWYYYQPMSPKQLAQHGQPKDFLGKTATAAVKTLQERYA